MKYDKLTFGDENRPRDDANRLLELSWVGATQSPRTAKKLDRIASAVDMHRDLPRSLQAGAGLEVEFMYLNPDDELTAQVFSRWRETEVTQNREDLALAYDRLAAAEDYFVVPNEARSRQRDFDRSSLSDVDLVTLHAMLSLGKPTADNNRFTNHDRWPDQLLAWRFGTFRKRHDQHVDGLLHELRTSPLDIQDTPRAYSRLLLSIGASARHFGLRAAIRSTHMHMSASVTEGLGLVLDDQIFQSNLASAAIESWLLRPDFIGTDVTQTVRVSDDRRSHIRDTGATHELRASSYGIINPALVALQYTGALSMSLQGRQELSQSEVLLGYRYKRDSVVSPVDQGSQDSNAYFSVAITGFMQPEGEDRRQQIVESVLDGSAPRVRERALRFLGSVGAPNLASGQDYFRILLDSGGFVPHPDSDGYSFVSNDDARGAARRQLLDCEVTVFDAMAAEFDAWSRGSVYERSPYTQIHSQEIQIGDAAWSDEKNNFRDSKLSQAVYGKKLHSALCGSLDQVDGPSAIRSKTTELLSV